MKRPSIVIASDSFKGSASSREVNGLLELGVRAVLPEARVRKFALADGGEGTTDALVAASHGAYRAITVADPLGDPVRARYGIVGAGDDETAIMEVAQACGFSLVEQTAENALRASSSGVGEMILDALQRGARHVLVGLGGSSTSDGGAGMARALGFRLLDADGREVAPGLAGLERIASIGRSTAAPELRGADFIALTDVTSPLFGEAGSIAAFGPQKGVPRERIGELDGWMRAYGELLGRTFGRDISTLPGAGAAGGLGAGIAAFCGGHLTSGADYVLDAIGFDEALEEADLVITGEGRMDAQTARGKAPLAVARRAREHDVPVVAIVGSRDADLSEAYAAGIDLVLPICTGPMGLEDSMREVGRLVPLAGETAARAFLLGRS